MPPEHPWGLVCDSVSRCPALGGYASWDIVDHDGITYLRGCCYPLGPSRVKNLLWRLVFTLQDVVGELVGSGTGHLWGQLDSPGSAMATGSILTI